MSRGNTIATLGCIFFLAVLCALMESWPTALFLAAFGLPLWLIDPERLIKKERRRQALVSGPWEQKRAEANEVERARRLSGVFSMDDYR